jgi:hypothetical protein
MAKRDFWWAPLAASVAYALVAGAGPRKRMMAQKDIVELARVVGFPDPELAAAVAMAESGGGNVLAVGDGGTSFGLWQIHTPAHPQFSAQALLDPNYNARAAFTISNQGADWSPWSAYNNGAYKRYLPTGRSV